MVRAQIIFVSITTVKLLLDFFEVLVFFVGDEGTDNVSVILKLLQSINLLLILRNHFILLKFYCVTSGLKQINHLFIIED